ncbi:hypothetical protein [Streptomyces sp. NBC_00572]|uniref:hypothetical protein n=1 Tax=Streptomyces sp. NBC_00572 TaxID=2903664 RepID=UPI0022571416|nr:hypothetical protein [Streptomyces sp. NBC_00572]MCX4982576.1 hypothetical protein [Streptomyces sp. NBC_00572]
MGIESDQLVYDYLSRVGDLAQQRQLPASDRMRLVSTLRNEIDRRRATHGEESPAAVRGILGALGTPDEVVERAEGPGAAPTPTPSPTGGAESAPKPVPKPRKEDRAGKRIGWVPRSRRSRDGAAPAAATKTDTTRSADIPDGGGSGEAGLVDMAGGDADWWRVDAAADLPGFVGGVERPDLFTEPVPDEEDEDEAEGDELAPGKRRRLARILLRRKPRAPETEPEIEAGPEAASVSRLRLANPFVLLAALLLLGGAVFGSLVALAAGWLIAYASRRLTPGEVKGAVLVIPGLAAASGIAWLWGRVEGRWGAPVAAGGEAMGAAISETWPWVLRGAAVASALFLLWRARRR